MPVNKVQGRARRLWIIAFTAAQALVLAGIALSYYAVGWYGQELRLRTVPVDPRDIFYGDYVTLSYEISRLEGTLWKEAEPPKRGDTAYVVVKPGSDGISVPVAAYRSKPALAAGETALKGIVQYGWVKGNGNSSDENFNESFHENFSVRYGIERYYVPEGTGKALEKQAAHLTVRVKSAPWGQPVIESIEGLQSGEGAASQRES
ncbi:MULTISPECIES: GDYXXLXY domain-containing protein [Paenibacillus]|uniref:GDYXXLXY domain-containing protein n=1 Tax=Paenibacillus TaxID=44249 RepID=UPI0022B8DF4F|nr:GDYXXLXY domain-containing protein [Paenibacillus caseinilyticus]MCZ8519004.1 GDYXXLXY domain-containing protein [Paenibacillus caseinilyticus]